ncbi:MAG: LPXTG cell wall anchor domain-containing protein, partial [Verrucomicrobia bacterium]|nr:LPXTG cell wall anchor domain-containing protein [Verrucomicrobiota bacterium]
NNTKRYNVSEMLSLTDFVTADALNHEFIAGKSLKLFSSLIRKLDFGDYRITINQKNHNVDPAYENVASLNNFGFTLNPGITVADGLNDYIKGKNVWIKFEACWPIDYDSDGTLAIRIGGQKISHDYYSISNDHQTLWIYRNLLDQLRSNNSYTLTARLWRLNPITGVKETYYPASASFNILAAGSTSYKSPKTGDNSNVALWAAVLVLSGGAVVALVPKKKKASK